MSTFFEIKERTKTEEGGKEAAWLADRQHVFSKEICIKNSRLKGKSG